MVDYSHMSMDQFVQTPQFQAVQDQILQEQRSGEDPGKTLARNVHRSIDQGLRNAGTGAKRAESVYKSPVLGLKPFSGADRPVKASKAGTASDDPSEPPPGAGGWTPGSAQHAKTMDYRRGSGQYVADQFIGPPSPKPQWKL